MRQHPDDFHDEDLYRLYDDDKEDPEELGTPVYQGSGLSVRALTADELQRFLDAHAGQPAQLLGSGWPGLDPPQHPLGGSWTSPQAGLEPLARQRRPQPGRPPAAWAAPAARPWPPPAAGVPRSWPPGPVAWPGGRRWSSPPASPATSSPTGPGYRGPGWSAWRLPSSSAVGCGFGPPSR
jgi:hypothetical protein